MNTSDLAVLEAAGFGAQQFMYGFGRTRGGVIVLVDVGRILLGLDLGNLGLVPGDDPASILPINLGFVMGFGAQQLLYGLTIGLGGVLVGEGDEGDVVVLPGLDPGDPDDDMEQVLLRDLFE